MYGLGAEGVPKFLVHGEPKPEPKPKKPHAKPSLDPRLPSAKLKIQCFDRATGETLQGVSVCISVVRETKDKTEKKNVTQAFGNKCESRTDGMVICKVLANYTYTITASTIGYLPFGSLGESLIATPEPNEVVEKRLGLVPIRVAVVMTLRELRPIQGKTLDQDTYGQVHPVHSIPKSNKLGGVPHQRVSFLSNAGSKQGFLASILTLTEVLRVVSVDDSTELGPYSTDENGHCFFYGPKIGRNRRHIEGHDGRVAVMDNGRWNYFTKFHLRANAESPPMPKFEDFQAEVEQPAHLARIPTRTLPGTNRYSTSRPTSPSKREPEEAGVTSAEGLMKTFLEASATVAAEMAKEAETVDAPGSPSVEEAAPRPPSPDWDMMPPSDGIHNYLRVGDYELTLTDPSLALIFYTNTGDAEAAEINQAQDATVPFGIMDGDSNDQDADPVPRRRLQLPIQLYCRARPWFQILVYDVDNLQEVGAVHGFSFKIERLFVNEEMEPQLEQLENYARASRHVKLAAMWASEVDGDGFDQTMIPPDIPPPPPPRDLSTVQCAWSAEMVLEGSLSSAIGKVWMTPGECYRVSLQTVSPYMEQSLVQCRMANWELEPFVFYAQRTINLLVGVRERYNLQPVRGAQVMCTITTLPVTPRPPVVKPEWCEGSISYARRVIAQLIDFVVETSEANKIDSEKVDRVSQAVTDDDGVATFAVPPLCTVHVEVVQTSEFDSMNSTVDRDLSYEQEQFMGIQLERVATIQASFTDALTGQGVEGCTIQVFLLEDQKGEPYNEPYLAFTASSADGDGMCPIFNSLAGTLARVDVISVARDYMMPSKYNGQDSEVLRLTGEHSVVFTIPKKPKTVVHIYDSTSGEEVMGVHFRVMVRIRNADGETVIPTHEELGIRPPPLPKIEATSEPSSEPSAEPPAETTMGVRFADEIQSSGNGGALANQNAEPGTGDATTADGNDLDNGKCLDQGDANVSSPVISDDLPQAPPPGILDVPEEGLWGLTLHDTYTGYKQAGELVLYCSTLEVEVAVQVYPRWPFTPDAQMVVNTCKSWSGTPDFVFYLMRDPDAYMFWMQRDQVAPTFWNRRRGDWGTPLKPYHSLARLQPYALNDNLLAPATEQLKFLQGMPMDDDEEGDGDDDGDQGTSVTGDGDEFSSHRSSEVDNGLRRSPSAIQFTEDISNAEDVRRLAWEHLRLSDPMYLGLERTTILKFLAKWGSFPHVVGGFCRACDGAQPSDTNPIMMVSKPSKEKVRVTVNTAASFKAAPSASFQSALVLGSGDQGTGYAWTAPWAVPRETEGNTKKAPGVMVVTGDPYNTTHAIIAKSEAVYCRTPFFLWWLSNGCAIHVGVHEALYREFVPLLDRVAASVELLDEHMKKVVDYNSTRTVTGAFLLGNAVLKEARGGLFLIDVSTAQPSGAISFILEQLSTVMESWAQRRRRKPPLINIIIASGDWYVPWRSECQPVSPNIMERLMMWYADNIKDAPKAVSFDFAKAVRAGLEIANNTVPLYVISGGIVGELFGSDCTEAALKTLYQWQLTCVERQAHMKPVHVIEMYPMPHLAAAHTSSAVKAAARDAGLAVGAAGGMSEAASEMTLDEARGGADIFERLQEALTGRRVRLVDAFREVDKDGDMALNSRQLCRLVEGLMPGVTPQQMRFLQIILDDNGDSHITYKSLALALKLSTKGEIAVPLSDNLELGLMLVKAALMCLERNLTSKEFFQIYDQNHSGYWETNEQWKLLKDMFPALAPVERQSLFGALQALDMNMDGRLSLDEWSRAFEAGGVPQMAAWGIAIDKKDIINMKAEETGEMMNTVMKSWEEHRRMHRVRSKGFPLHQLLVRMAGVTGGMVRRLDMGHARAFAEQVNTGSLEAVRNSLSKQLELMKQFEQEYGLQLNRDRASRRNPSRMMNGLTSDPLSPKAVRSALVRSKSSNNRAESAGRRPPSAKRKERKKRELDPDSRLLDNTFARDKYCSETASTRAVSTTNAPSSELNLPSWRPSSLNPGPASSTRSRPASARMHSTAASVNPDPEDTEAEDIPDDQSPGPDEFSDPFQSMTMPVPSETDQPVEDAGEGPDERSSVVRVPSSLRETSSIAEEVLARGGETRGLEDAERASTSSRRSRPPTAPSRRTPSLASTTSFSTSTYERANTERREYTPSSSSRSQSRSRPTSAPTRPRSSRTRSPPHPVPTYSRSVVSPTRKELHMMPVTLELPESVVEPSSQMPNKQKTSLKFRETLLSQNAWQ